MPVNKFETPYINNARETYVSQHVEVPYAQMQRAAERKQLEYNIGEEKAEALEDSFLKQKALNKDKALKNEIVQGYNSRLEQALVQTNGNYAEAMQMIKGVAKDAKQDMAFGRLGAIDTNLRAQQAYTKDVLAKYDAGDIGVDRVQKLLADANGKYQGVQSEVQSTGIYNTYSGQMAAKEYNVDELVETASKDYAASMVDQNQWFADGDGYMKKVGNSLEKVSSKEIRDGAMGYLKRHKGFQEDLAQSNYLEGRSEGEAATYNQSLMMGAANRAAGKYSYQKVKHYEEMKSDPTALAAMKKQAKLKDLPFFAKELNIVGEAINGKDTEEFVQAGKDNVVNTANAWHDGINLALNKALPATKEGAAAQYQLLKDKYQTDDVEEAKRLFLEDLDGGSAGDITSLDAASQKELARNLRFQEVVNTDHQNRHDSALDEAHEMNPSYKEKTLKFREKMSGIGVPDYALDMMEKEEATMSQALDAAMRKAYFDYVKPENRGSFHNIEDIKNSGAEGAAFAEKYLNAVESSEFMNTYSDWHDSHDGWRKTYDKTIEAGGKSVNKMWAVDHVGAYPVPDGNGGWEMRDSSKYGDHFSKSVQEDGGAVLNGVELTLDQGAFGEKSTISFEDLKEELRTDGDNAKSGEVDVSKVRFSSAPVGGVNYVSFSITNKENGKSKSVILESSKFLSSMGQTIQGMPGYMAKVSISNARQQGSSRANIYDGQNQAIGGYDSTKEKAFVWVDEDASESDVMKDPTKYVRVDILTKKDREGLKPMYLSDNNAVKIFTPLYD